MKKLVTVESLSLKNLELNPPHYALPHNQNARRIRKTGIHRAGGNNNRRIPSLLNERNLPPYTMTLAQILNDAVRNVKNEEDKMKIIDLILDAYNKGLSHNISLHKKCSKN